MSYLLDALRKAERERHPERAPDLTQWHAADAAGRREGLPGWVAPTVAILALLNVGALSAFWLLREPEGATPKNEVVSQTLPGGRVEPAGTDSRRTPRGDPAVLPHRRIADDPVNDDYLEPAGSIAALPAATRDRLPPIEVNGHLYSSIPGRSFLLVNGRRYREGERLREGPAVESIDETGAVLNYRGERFRVAAPR